MLRVQETNPPKRADEKRQTREFSRAEHKNKGFLDELLKVAEERKKEDETKHLYVDRFSGTYRRGGSE